MLELEAGFAGAGAELLEEDVPLLEDVPSPADFDSAGFDSVFDSLDDSEAGLSELELEEDFDA